MQIDNIRISFGQPGIYNLIFSPMSPRSLALMSQTCWTIYVAISDFSRKAYNINKFLIPFFESPKVFRSLQACTGTLLSGSYALQFMDRSDKSDNSVVLYTFPHHLQEVVDFLIDSEKYCWVRSNDETELELGDISSIGLDVYDELYYMLFERQRPGGPTMSLTLKLSWICPFQEVLEGPSCGYSTLIN